ncbi:MAG: hypothetical protein HFE81_06340 [Bacilli bacterium]|nr:hypothetical protein [Bacilli bacterium]
MTINDLKELLEYIMKNNSWKEFSYLYQKRKQPKYIDVKVWFTLDTRDGIIFYLKTRNAGKDKSFRIEDKNDLQKVYKWLDEVKGDNNE